MFLLVFSLIPLNWVRVADFNFHLAKAAENCVEKYEEDRCNAYFPLLHFLGKPFSYSPIAFSHFLMILILFITPILLFFSTKHWMTIWLYFAATQYVYAIQAGGAYPQALAGIFVIIFFLIKNNWIKAGILPIAILAHSQAFVLLLLIWTVQLLFENQKNLKNMFPACSALFGRQEVDPISNRIGIQAINKNGLQFFWLELKDVANFFVRVFPFPFLLMAFYQLWKEKDWVPLVVSIIIFYYGFANASPRMLWTIPLILLPSLTRFYMALEGKWKYAFLILSLITFLFNFGTWMAYKIRCVE